MISNIVSIFQSSGMTFGEKVLYVAMFLACILFSLIIHECAHGWVALKCGDATAKWMGRLTLNPLKHLDPIGTVPINPRNFRNYRRDYILVSVAGIAVNTLIFLVSTFLSVVALNNMKGQWVYYVFQLLIMLAQMNLCLAVFNLLPVPPLDGFRLLDQLVFKGSLNLSQQAMRYIQIGFLFVCVSGMLNGLLNTVIGTVFNAVFNFFLSVLG